jgi:hypothetical protein
MIRMRTPAIRKHDYSGAATNLSAHIPRRTIDIGTAALLHRHVAAKHRFNDMARIVIILNVDEARVRCKVLEVRARRDARGGGENGFLVASQEYAARSSCAGSPVNGSDREATMKVKIADKQETVRTTTPYVAG